MSIVKAHKITKTDIKAALDSARRFLGSSGDFSRAARREFDLARAYAREETSRANDLARILKRQPEAKIRDCESAAAHLVALAECVNALACLQCNGVRRNQFLTHGTFYDGGSWTEADERQEQETRAVLVAEMDALLADCGARVVSSYGDPRGAVVHIAFPDKSSNRCSDVWGL